MSRGRSLAGVLLLVSACNSVPPKQPRAGLGTIRYSLPLRNNSVSSSEASRCFAECQSANTPKAYVECLMQCPGFEMTPGQVCSSTDVPPESACVTVRKIPAKTEPPPGLVVLAIVGEVALVVGASSLCSISSSQCGLGLPPPR